MEPQIHTVLGASGTTGRAVIDELKRRGITKIRAVERTAKLTGIETFEANLLVESEAIQAIQDSAYVYLCVGLPYAAKVWATDWPKLMNHVIHACQLADAKLIFLDNIYLYSQPLALPFDEQQPQHPTTKKGIARKETADLLLQAMAENRVKAVIGRSADFYGAHAVNSPFYISFLQNMLQGKAPVVLSQSNVSHTYAFSGDNGRALVALALDHTSYGQVWHLPVGKPVSFEEINEMMNRELGTGFRLGALPKALRHFLSVFVPPLREVGEMLYQFNEPYEMNFDKFKNHFPDFEITSYQEGIKCMIDSFKNK